MTMHANTRDVARAVMALDAFPGGIRLPALEELARLTLHGVLGRNAAFDEHGECVIDLGNGFDLVCTVKPHEVAK